MKVKGVQQAQIRVQRFARDYRAGVERVLLDSTATIERRMKQEHRWQNQTYAAEHGLVCHLLTGEDGTYKLVAMHTVDYGVYLEARSDLRVLWPTMRSEWPRVMARLRALTSGGEA